MEKPIIYKANDFVLYMALMEADGITPLDLLNKKVSFIVKKDARDEDETAVLPRLDYLNSPTNELIFSYTGQETKLLAEGIYYCAVKIYEESGCQNEIYSSELEVSSKVFKD